MIIPPIAFDLEKMAARVGNSALPNAPIVPEPDRREGKVVPAIRRQMTIVLRRLADVLEPASIQTATR
jgi:hypothetical protein